MDSRIARDIPSASHLPRSLRRASIEEGAHAFAIEQSV
jgi:hypothetical protein